MVVRGGPHRRFDVVAEGRAGHTLRIGPDQRVGRTVERTVAGEAEGKCTFQILAQLVCHCH